MKVKKSKSYYFLIFIVVLITLLMIFPFVWTIVMSFKTDTDIINAPLALPKVWNFDNYIRALKTLDIFAMYKNTFFIVIVTQIVSLVITFMSSFAICRMKFKNKKIKNFLYIYYLIGISVPVYILLFPIYRINIQLGVLDTPWSLILPYIAITIPFNTLLFVGFMKGFPKELEEAAIIDGCNLFQLCTRVVVPILKPVIATVTVFNVIYNWNEFPFAVTYISSPANYTVSLATSMFKGAYSRDYSAMIAAAVLIMIPQLIFYALLQKQIIAGMTEGAVKA
ncbi:MAG: carbohydrate ABC transporter permease [Ruminococcus sp.]|nr:carbohydrate ABC transporter permease [Ruminococcus sp.]